MKINIPEDEIKWSYTLSSGSGGQNLQKTQTKVSCTWDFQSSSVLDEVSKNRFKNLFSQYILADGNVFITSQKTRSQKNNKQDCIKKLILLIEKSMIEPKRRIPSKPKKSAIEKRLKNKKIHSLVKKMRSHDF